MNDQFARIAPFYDELMSGVPYIFWMGYLETLLDRFNASPLTVLDVACGTGNVTELIAAHGYEVVGVDLSAPMIEMAKQKAAEQNLQIEYHAQDVAELDLGGRKFDLGVSFFDSLNYVSDPGQLQKGFDRIAAHLQPGALFIFDLNTEFALANKMFDQQSMKRGAPLRYRWRSEWDENTRLCRIEMEFWLTQAEGKPERITVTHVQRAYSHGEIRRMLENAGMEHLAVYQSYSLRPPRSGTDRVHHVARVPDRQL